MAHKRFTAHIGDRGRVVVPAEARRQLELLPGDLVVIDVGENSLTVRKATEVADGFRGYLRDVDPDRDLAAELISERRLEADREAGRGEEANRASGTGAGV
jgi:AbrB family looped-hinge helix DNA binding protein